MKGEFTPEKGNLALMINDVKEALRTLTERGESNTLQAGIFIGLNAAAYVLEGYTADETWEEIRPRIELVLRGDGRV